MKHPLIRAYFAVLFALALLSDLTGGLTAKLWGAAAAPGLVIVLALMALACLGLMFGLIAPKRR